MTRVMVIGNAGGGKSTLCSAICAAHDLPYHSIDKLQWKPNWVPTPPAEFKDHHDALLWQARWVIDGYGPLHSVDDRLDACDTVVFVDHPIGIHLWWATKRQVKSLFVGRPDGPDGCPMWRVTFRLYRMIWRLHRETRPQLIETIYRRSERVRIIHITSPAELKRFGANPI